MIKKRDRLAVTIHANAGIAWQRRRVPDFVAGLETIGYVVTVTDRRARIDANPAVLFGTTFWQEIERAPGDWLLVDRASIGDPDYVTLGWNGRGLRGEYLVPAEFDAERWSALGVELQPARDPGSSVIICGEADGSHPNVPGTYFRPHPAGGNPTSLPPVTDWVDGHYHGLRSSVLVEAVIRGYPTTAHDPSSMIYGMQDRDAWARWIAWTQWNWQEIRRGEIRHIFDESDHGDARVEFEAVGDGGGGRGEGAAICGDVRVPACAASGDRGRAGR